MTTWVKIEKLFWQMRQYQYALGLERYEDILDSVRDEIEAHTGRRISYCSLNRIQPRVRKKYRKLLAILQKIAIREGAQKAAPFFSELYTKMHLLLAHALHANNFPAPPSDDENIDDLHPDF